MRCHLNVGTGTDVTIRELAETIARVTGFRGELVFDPGKPDGTPRKLLDVSRLQALGWKATIGLEEGLRDPMPGFGSMAFQGGEGWALKWAFCETKPFCWCAKKAVRGKK